MEEEKMAYQYNKYDLIDSERKWSIENNSHFKSMILNCMFSSCIIFAAIKHQQLNKLHY